MHSHHLYILLCAMGIRSSFVGIMSKLGSQSLVHLKAPMAFSSFSKKDSFFSWRMCCVCFLKSTPVIQRKDFSPLNVRFSLRSGMTAPGTMLWTTEQTLNHTAASPPLALWWPEFPALLQNQLLSFILLKKETFGTEFLRGDRMRKGHFSGRTVHRLETKWSSPSACFRGG